MRNTLQELLFRRVVVVLDATSDPGRTLESAANLARRFDVELLAFFVEDRRLQQLEGHPMARVVDLPTGLGHTVARGSMQRHWRALARRTQRRLGDLARDYQINTSFESIGGDVMHELHRRLDGSDLLVVEHARRHLSCATRSDSRSRLLARDVASPVIFSGEPGPLRSVVVLYDGSAMARRSLDTALRLGARRSIMLTLVLVGRSREFEQSLREQAARQIGERGIGVELHIRRIMEPNLRAMAAVAASVHAELLILADDHDAFEGLSDQLHCPLMILRGDAWQTDESDKRELAVER